MATFTKQRLSKDSTGSGFRLFDGVPEGIHSTENSPNILDEIWLYVVNNSFSNKGILQISWQGEAMFMEIPVLSGAFLVIPGFIISGNGVGPSEISVVDMTGLFENSLYVHGFINRITP